ncbi:MAG: phospholipase [Candidatus Nitrohelix vancouverensis]|uniref:Phospholipase n=1 Tax=Candidatus Nitrohelix vancouverensis TaxID=2705534 RepID=A0A7T0G3Q0_9BACT|nr:MAG: phospholipase [Candidatus Nitrohelix vancouverensis]
MTIHYSNGEVAGKKTIFGNHSIAHKTPLRILIGFHGADSTPENMLIHGNKLQMENTLAVFPEGPVDAGEGLWSWWKDGPKQMESVKEFLEFATRAIEDTEAFARQNYSPTEIQTCLWGFSQGGAASLVYSLLGKRPIHKVASVCGFLPELPDVAAEARNAQIFGIFGANDEVVPSFLAEFALDELKGRGLQVTARETSQGHEMNLENIRHIEEFFNSNG